MKINKSAAAILFNTLFRAFNIRLECQSPTQFSNVIGYTEIDGVTYQMLISFTTAGEYTNFMFSCIKTNHTSNTLNNICFTDFNKLKEWLLAEGFTKVGMFYNALNRLQEQCGIKEPKPFKMPEEWVL